MLKIADRIKMARETEGLSIQDLSKKSRIDCNKVEKYDSGEEIPDSNDLIKLSIALKVKIEYFFRSENSILDNKEYSSGKLFKKIVINDFINKRISESKAAELFGIPVVKFREL